MNGDRRVHLRSSLGLKEVLHDPDRDNTILTIKLVEALDVVQGISASDYLLRVCVADGAVPMSSCAKTRPMDESLLSIVRKYGEKILLKESDMKPKISRKKGKKRSSVVMVNKEKRESSDEWEGPPPWDFTVGGDGCPKFLCDVMVSADNSLCVF